MFLITMLAQAKLALRVLGLAVLVQCSVLATQARAQGLPKKAMKIGMVDSLFTDVSPVMVKMGSVMFATLMKTSTGMDGEMVTGGQALTVGKHLSEGKLDLAVFQGVEFAWAQQRYPDLRPLMIAVTKYRHSQACIVVAKDGPISSFARLQGKPFVMPLCSPEHCRLFLQQCCTESGCGTPHKAFTQIVKSNVEDALDDICTGKFAATVVDKVALENYEQLKPGCFARLRILKTSAQFPCGVIAYREGAISKDKLSKFTTGLLKADKTDLGQEMMKGFKISSFQAVPDNYAQMLSDIMKIYPPPATVTAQR